MCGITGIYSPNGQIDEIKLDLMTSSLSHRGPDDNGLWIDDAKRIGLGHRRLSIVDLSSRGKQPFSYAEGRFQITYNGEIYNYLELREELKKNGYEFHTETDTEVLLALFHWKGKEMLSLLDGMFAFAIWDNASNELFCARDRFGEKPFYYILENGIFYFASEIKAFWKAGFQKQIDESKVFSYLVYGGIRNFQNPSETFFKGIKSLNPSHFFVLDKNLNIEIKKYWELSIETAKTQLSFESAKEQFVSLFEESINKRLRSDVSLGSSLSGGLDSSSIVHTIHSASESKNSQFSFSARFPNFKKDEGPIIDEFLKDHPDICPSFIYPNVESVSSNFKSLVNSQDEPFGSLSIAAQYEVMQEARNKKVPVLMDGQGADEILGGYAKFYHVYLSEIKRSNPKLFLEELNFSKLSGSNFSQKPKTQRFLSSSPLIKSTLRKGMLKLNPSHSYFAGLNPEFVRAHYKNPTEKEFKTAKELMKYSLLARDIPELLRYADRNSMAHSIETRLPFLNHKLVEFVFSLPSHFLFSEAWTKFILRSHMDKKIHDDIVWNRKKIGFEPPQESWLKSAFFQKKIEEAKEFLLQEKIVQQTHDQLNWKYIMLYEYMS